MQTRSDRIAAAVSELIALVAPPDGAPGAHATMTLPEVIGMSIGGREGKGVLSIALV